MKNDHSNRQLSRSSAREGFRQALLRGDRGLFNAPGKTTDMDVSAADVLGRTALTRAAMAGDVERTREMIAAGAPVNAADREGMTALHHAMAGAHFDVADVLLGVGGANINYSDAGCDKGLTPLQTAIYADYRDGRTDRCVFLIARGANVDAANRLGLSAADTLDLLAGQKPSGRADMLIDAVAAAAREYPAALPIDWSGKANVKARRSADLALRG